VQLRARKRQGGLRRRGPFHPRDRAGCRHGRAGEHRGDGAGPGRYVGVGGSVGSRCESGPVARSARCERLAGIICIADRQRVDRNHHRNGCEARGEDAEDAKLRLFRWWLEFLGQ